jgi:hypothetical protein
MLQAPLEHWRVFLRPSPAQPFGVHSFATTYALGQVAKQYYAGDRSISMDQLKQIFSSLLEQGKVTQANYAGEIQQWAGTVDTRRIAGLSRG